MTNRFKRQLAACTMASISAGTHILAHGTDTFAAIMMATGLIILAFGSDE